MSLLDKINAVPEVEPNGHVLLWVVGGVIVVGSIGVLIALYMAYSKRQALAGSVSTQQTTSASASQEIPIEKEQKPSQDT